MEDKKLELLDRIRRLRQATNVWCDQKERERRQVAEQVLSRRTHTNPDPKTNPPVKEGG